MIPLRSNNASKVVFSHEFQNEDVQVQKYISYKHKEDTDSKKICIDPTILDHHKRELLHHKFKALKLQLSLQEASNFRMNASIRAYWREIIDIWVL